MPRNIWQVAKIQVAHIDHWWFFHGWLLKPAWGRHGCYSAFRKLSQCSGSSVVSVVILFEDGRYGSQLIRPAGRHVYRLRCVGPSLHPVTPALRQDEHGCLLQPFCLKLRDTSFRLKPFLAVAAQAWILASLVC